MIVLGIESSCDECSIALVEDGKRILGHVIHSQVEIHKSYEGVVPEIASRAHLQTIAPVFDETLKQSGLKLEHIEACAVSVQPGLSGSLQVGLSFAKGFSWARGIPYIGVDHILGHLYAAQLEVSIDYPHLALLASGGHSIIGICHSFERFEVLGASIDDAIGEAFDKVAKHHGLGYPGGKLIDELARQGKPLAFKFPLSRLDPTKHRFDVSYSGLKNAVINQSDKFWDGRSEKNLPNIAASFEKVAVDMLYKQVLKAAEQTGLSVLVAGGGVAANTYLRTLMNESKHLQTYYPSLQLCGDNAAMIAGLGYHFLKAGQHSTWEQSVKSRVKDFRHLPLS